MPSRNFVRLLVVCDIFASSQDAWQVFQNVSLQYKSQEEQGYPIITGITGGLACILAVTAAIGAEHADRPIMHLSSGQCNPLSLSLCCNMPDGCCWHNMRSWACLAF